MVANIDQTIDQVPISKFQLEKKKNWSATVIDAENSGWKVYGPNQIKKVVLFEKM